MSNVIDPRSATELDVEIGQRLRQVRESRDISQRVLAERLGITHQQVQKYEDGKNRLTVSRLDEICKVLEIAPHYFFEVPSSYASAGLDENPQASLAGGRSPEERKLLVAFSRLKSRDQRKAVIRLVNSMADGEG
jgi:transcriptional regulator with XRE-family HTH domain